MKGTKRLLTLIVMTALLLGSVSATRPQITDDNCRYFAQTGHYVCDEFLEFYDTRGGLEIFGYPLTGAFADLASGVQVQYFQRARMEWRPWNPDPYRVQLGLLADELGHNYPRTDQDQIPAVNSALYHYFPETDHVVSHAFLQYFRENGELDIFGYPRSESMYEDGYRVQYFQRARLEWHPEAIQGSQMRLSLLGETYIERFGIPAGYDDPNPGPYGLEITRLNVSASVRHVITGQPGAQTIFVYVNDQQGMPIQNANARAVVHYQSDRSDDPICDSFGPTDANGFTQCGFSVLPSPPGQKVVIDVIVTRGNLTATTQTFFLPWW
jgi:hypothetical protein